MDIGKSFTFMFDDEKWVQKLAIGGLLLLASIIPLVNIFTGLVVLGYTLRLLKNVSEGSATPLPEWDDWGGDFVKGLMAALGALIYSVPILLASGISAIVSAVAANAADPGAAETVTGICMAGISCLSALWGLLVGVVYPAAMVKYVQSGEFGAFFRFGEIFAFIKDNLSNYIIALLLMIVAGLVSGLGVIACVIGLFFTQFWSNLVGMHLLGQVANQAKPQTAAAASGYAKYGEIEEVSFDVPAPPEPPAAPEPPEPAQTSGDQPQP